MSRIILTLFTLALMWPQGADAQKQVDQNVLRHAAGIASFCPGQWESDKCLKAVSLSNKDMGVMYAARLDAAGKKDSVEAVKNVCAAASVTEEEVEEEVPAYAFRSAYTECANGLYEISQATGIQPDPTHMQILISAVYCLNEAPQCAAIEKSMAAGRAR